MPLASEIVKEMSHIIGTDGDYEVEISCIKPNPATESQISREQGYLISSPTFVLVEEYEDGKRICLRDWPY